MTKATPNKALESLIDDNMIRLTVEAWVERSSGHEEIAGGEAEGQRTVADQADD